MSWDWLFTCVSRFLVIMMVYYRAMIRELKNRVVDRNLDQTMSTDAADLDITYSKEQLSGMLPIYCNSPSFHSSFQSIWLSSGAVDPVFNQFTQIGAVARYRSSLNCFALELPMLWPQFSRQCSNSSRNLFREIQTSPTKYLPPLQILISTLKWYHSPITITGTWVVSLGYCQKGKPSTFLCLTNRCIIAEKYIVLDRRFDIWTLFHFVSLKTGLDVDYLIIQVFR